MRKTVDLALDFCTGVLLSVALVCAIGAASVVIGTRVLVGSAQDAWNDFRDRG